MNKDLAKRTYSAYCAITEYKNFLVDPVPKFEDLPEKIQDAWSNVASEAIDQYFIGLNRIVDD